MLYLYSGDEYFLSSIASSGNPTIERNAGGFTKDDSCTIAKSLLVCMFSQEHEDHAFLYVEVMSKECNRREFVQKFHGKSGLISRITCTDSTG